MPKPIGPVCNLHCAYCYYLEKEKLYPDNERWPMSDETLELLVRQYIAAQPPAVDEIVFGWQGGEPTLLGVPFFRRAVELQKKHTPPGRRCANAIQTNGVLLDEEWCSFFYDNGFLVGISIDGPADLHDKYRHDKHGRPTFDQVMRGLRCLQDQGVEFNALTVVNSHNGSHPRRVYRFLTDSGIEFIQFIPIVERLPGEGIAHLDAADPGRMVTDRSVRPQQFGRFMIEVFDEWAGRDVGRVFVQSFDQALSAWVGIEPALCIFRRQCGQALAMEHNGDLYSCDHFVDPAHKLGNIHETPLAELVSGPAQIRFGRDKEATLPKSCFECPVCFACNGGCPKNRFVRAPDGKGGLNYLCEGYRMFFTHIRPSMEAMANEIRNGRPAANVMHRLTARRQSAPAHSRSPDGCAGFKPDD